MALMFCQSKVSLSLNCSLAAVLPGALCAALYSKSTKTMKEIMTMKRYRTGYSKWTGNRLEYLSCSHEWCSSAALLRQVLKMRFIHGCIKSTECQAVCRRYRCLGDVMTNDVYDPHYICWPEKWSLISNIIQNKKLRSPHLKFGPSKSLNMVTLPDIVSEASYLHLGIPCSFVDESSRQGGPHRIQNKGKRKTKVEERQIQEWEGKRKRKTKWR